MYNTAMPLDPCCSNSISHGIDEFDFLYSVDCCAFCEGIISFAHPRSTRIFDVSDFTHAGEPLVALIINCKPSLQIILFAAVPDLNCFSGDSFTIPGLACSPAWIDLQHPIPGK